MVPIEVSRTAISVGALRNCDQTTKLEVANTTMISMDISALRLNFMNQEKTG
jgi:hypothetical protein